MSFGTDMCYNSVMSRVRKDSRFRTVQRENGRVFCVWFDVKFQRPDDSAIDVGHEVELLAGSTIQVAVIRDRLTNREESWLHLGVLGGESQFKRVREEWEKIQAELGNPAPVVPESMKLKVVAPVANHKARATVVETALATKKPAAAAGDQLRLLAADYNFTSFTTVVHIRFKTENAASSFSMAARKRGMDVDYGIEGKEVLIKVG